MKGGLIALTEIILHCQIKYLMRDSLRTNLWCIRFWPKQKIKAVRAIGQYRISHTTAVSAIPLAEKHCHHLKKKATLKFLNDIGIMCSKAISIRSTEFDVSPPQNMVTNNNKTLLIKKWKPCRKTVGSIYRVLNWIG